MEEMRAALQSKNHVQEIINFVVADYDFRRRKILEESPRKHSINLICRIDGLEIDVTQIEIRFNDLLEVEGTTDDGIARSVLIPIENAAEKAIFIIEYTETTSLKPPREIGFKPNMANAPQ
jgi:hypothetical protein